MLKFPVDWRFSPPPAAAGGVSMLSPEAAARFRVMVLQVAGICSDRWQALERFKTHFLRVTGERDVMSTSESWAETDLLTAMQAATGNPATYVEALVESMSAVADLCDNNIPSEHTINAVLAESGLGFRLQGDSLKPLEAHAVPPPLPATPPPKYSRPANVLISSPGDLREERLLLIQVCKDVAAKLGIPVRAILWEGGGAAHPDVPPFAPLIQDKSAQEIIDAHLVDGLGGLDVYVGMIWSKMGTPTGKYRSGTEAELEAAVDAWKKTGRPSVMFYQKRGSLPESVDTAQLNLVRVFVKELEDRGLRGEFRSNEELARIFAHHLEQALVEAAKHMTAQDPAGLRCPQCNSSEMEAGESAEPDYDTDEDGRGYVSGVSLVPYVKCNACGWTT